MHQALRELSDEEGLPSFRVIEINGMKLSSPYQVYSLLWDSLLITCQSPANHLPITCQSPAAASGAPLVTCQSPANHLPITCIYSQL